MCTIVATTHNPAIRAFAQWVRQQDKPAKVVLTAVIRKLLHLVYGILKLEEAYNPSKAFRTTAFPSGAVA